MRTFIALELPAGLKDRLAGLQKTFMQSVSGVKWVRPDNMHLTLKFLGDTPVDRVEKVSGVLEHLTRGVAPFVFDAAGIGAFPNSRNPKVIWAGMQVDQRLREFYEVLEAALANMGIAREDRPFAPHLTLGRVREGRARKDIAALVEQYAAEPLGRFEADRIIYFRSELKPSGPVYAALKESLLTKSA